MNRRPERVNSLLVIQLAGLGDMVMATPTLSALRKLYPQAKIALLTNSRSADIVRGLNDIDEILTLDSFLQLGTLKKLRFCRFDMVINLYRLYSFKGAIKMFLLFCAVAGQYWVGRDTDGRGFFYHLKVPEKLSDKKHEIEYKLDIIRALGGQMKDINLRTEYDKDDENVVSALLSREGIEENDIVVGINCSTFRPSRNWMLEGYAQLADDIIEKLKVKVAFLGVAKDKDLLRAIKKSMKHKPLDFVGDFNVRQFVFFLKRCRLLISPDSGTVHIASSLGVPMVVLFGPGEYERYRPYGNEERTIVIKKQVQCAPCFKNVCRNKRCMESITHEEVFAATEQLLSKF
ncbi:MAG: glycosyltransferase family 9 protein [Candidatus Omnitrophota bacterium]|nr:MAG: glycosyltransferase family 9 protein [Candidatus Omnitrophota bacterium]